MPENDTYITCLCNDNQSYGFFFFSSAHFVRERTFIYIITPEAHDYEMPISHTFFIAANFCKLNNTYYKVLLDKNDKNDLFRITIINFFFFLLQNLQRKINRKSQHELTCV